MRYSANFYSDKAKNEMQFNLWYNVKKWRRFNQLLTFYFKNLELYHSIGKIYMWYTKIALKIYFSLL